MGTADSRSAGISPIGWKSISRGRCCTSSKRGMWWLPCPYPAAVEEGTSVLFPGSGGPGRPPPRGVFASRHTYPGWRYAALGALYRPWYFKGGFAIHGSTSVPAFPASHGCIRVTIQDADWLSERLSIGFRVNVRITIPREDPPAAPAMPSFTQPPSAYS